MLYDVALERIMAGIHPQMMSVRKDSAPVPSQICSRMQHYWLHIVQLLLLWLLLPLSVATFWVDVLPKYRIAIEGIYLQACRKQYIQTNRSIHI